MGKATKSPVLNSNNSLLSSKMVGLFLGNLLRLLFLDQRYSEPASPSVPS
jgi:hypothetical protein